MLPTQTLFKNFYCHFALPFQKFIVTLLKFDSILAPVEENFPLNLSCCDVETNFDEILSTDFFSFLFFAL